MESYVKKIFPKMFKRSISNALFISAIIIIVVINCLTFWQVSNLRTANQWVVHTYKVIGTTQALLNNILLAETRQRGYLLFNDTRYKAELPYLTREIKNQINQLLDLTRDNSQQIARITKLNMLINSSLERLKSLANLKDNNTIQQPYDSTIFEQSKQITEQILFLTNEINTTEYTLLTERSNAVTRYIHTANLIQFIGQIASLMLFIIAFLIFNRAQNYSHIVESQLRSIISSVNDMIAAVDKNYQYIIFNAAYQKEFEELFDKRIEIGTSMLDVFEDDPHLNRLVDSWKRSMRGEKQPSYNINFQRNGKEYIYEVNPSVIQDTHHEIVGAVHIIRNITHRIQEQKELKMAYTNLQHVNDELKHRNEKISTLLEMSDVMLACESINELGTITTKYCHKVLTFTSGHMYIMHPSKNYLEVSASWGKSSRHANNFGPDQCWALRLGHIHSMINKDDLVCGHVDGQSVTPYMCVPLRAKSDIYGLLYVEIPSIADIKLSTAQKLIINAFAEVAALALANVRLRENLHHQSIHDPLTSLYNRRYLEEFLSKQIYQANRKHIPIALLMLDLDHFKRVNDVHGHDAGDAILREFSVLLESSIRSGDVASRFGGEEFVIAMYDTSKEVAVERANKIREATSRLHIKYGAQEVGQITVSIGLAFYPKDGANTAELMEVADKRLYIAKRTGRNKVVYAEIKVSDDEKVPS